MLAPGVINIAYCVERDAFTFNIAQLLLDS